MGTIKDLTGKKYGMLTVENRGADRYGKTGRKFITWDCICECGNHIGYDDSLTIERIDNNGNYEPDNCKWIPIEMQASDRRSSRILTYNGKSQTMAQWARELNISEDMLRERIVVLHWGVEDALLTPSQTRGWSNEQRQLSRFRDSVWVR